MPPGPLAPRERRAIPGAVCEERATKPEGTAERSPQGRVGEGHVSCFVAAPRRCVPASPASRRLASVRPALAPKCTGYFLQALSTVLARCGQSTTPRRRCPE